MASTGTVRPSAFEDEDTSAKRRKIAYDSENDSGDELFDGYIEEATLPLNTATPTQLLNSLISPSKPNGVYSSVATQPLTSSPPPLSSFTTQPTQALPTPTKPTQQALLPPPTPTPAVQVEASSPITKSPLKPSVEQSQSKPALPEDGSVRPFEFYATKSANPNAEADAGEALTKPIKLDDDGPIYIGSSSEDEDKHTFKPVFGSSPVRRPIPSLSAIRGRKEHALSPPASVPESPMGKPLTRLPYEPTKASKLPYDPTKKTGRLDSLARRPLPVGVSASMQRRPEPATSAADISVESISNVEYRATVARMKSVLPQKRVSVLLNALIQAGGHYDDAMEQLLNSVDLTGEDGGATAAAAIKTANRGTGAGKVAIKDKWSKTQVNNRDLASSPPATTVPKKRKLVRGSNRTSRERSESPAAAVIADDSDSDAAGGSDSEDDREFEVKVLSYINVCSAKELADIAATTDEIAEIIIAQRPYKSIDAIREVAVPAPTNGKKRGGRSKPIGDKVIDVCLETMKGYEAVDSLINKVEALGKPIAESIRSWGVDVQTGTTAGELDMTDLHVGSDTGSAKDSGIGTPTDEGDNDVTGKKRTKTVTFYDQPKNMKEGIQLKDYQVAGLNWLALLYEKKLSCILADEMGLGKTCQVISFFAHLLTKGITGPHLVVVPSSTLENWLREFANFCPELKVEPYYGSQKERPMMREMLRKNRSWNVLVTTYQLATGDKNDRGFLKSLNFNCCVYDEGHLLKNGNSSRYEALVKLPAEFRLLLTGTPLQNNLQELASLLAFILPKVFDERKADLASIFKYKAKTTVDEEANAALLSQQRIKRARAMMTPFVLRRKKAQVLKHLPTKTSRVQLCALNSAQSKIYQEQIANARESLEARAAGKKANKSSSNVMMQLRKAAIHPLLFRSNYPDDKLRKMVKDIMKEEAYRNNNADYIYEDMEIMNDLELTRLCENFPKTMGKYALKKQEWMNSGKVDELKSLLVDMKKNGDRVLVFSQFTQVLDVLEMVLTTLDMGYLRIDGSTAVDARQDLIDQYHQETDIMVFLLSTKAGGFGINLACANKVVIFDSSFNPHDDAQASDRAHRVGQTRPVEVIRLITKGTIEEQILQLANTKLALDQSISEGDEKAIEGKGEELVAKMLLQSTAATSTTSPLAANDEEKKE